MNHNAVVSGKMELCQWIHNETRVFVEYQYVTEAITDSHY